MAFLRCRMQVKMKPSRTPNCWYFEYVRNAGWKDERKEGDWLEDSLMKSEKDRAELPRRAAVAAVRPDHLGVYSTIVTKTPLLDVLR